MNRREFSKSALLMGIGAGVGTDVRTAVSNPGGEFYEEPEKKLSVRKFDVVVAGAGTGGVVAAIAAALCAAKNLGARDLKYAALREALTKAGVYLESYRARVGAWEQEQNGETS